MTEKSIRKKIKQHFERCGWCVIPYIQTGYCVAGVPDLILVGEGRVVFVETKQPGEKPTAKQNEWKTKLENRGATVIVATCLEDVLTPLGERGG